MLARLASFCYRRRWRVLAIWVIALVGISVLGQSASGNLLKTYTLSGTDSQAAFDQLKNDFGRKGDTGQIVFEAERGDARSIAAPDGLPRHFASSPGPRWRAAGSRGRLGYLVACAPRRGANAAQSPRTPSAAHSPQP